MVIWIIGMSGSGKSFYGKNIESILSKKHKTIHIDGDEVREYITDELKYTKKDRKKNSLIIRKLCKFLEAKGYLVICSILSIFPDHQKNNRKYFNKYIQIYIKADIKILKTKNNKKIYLKKNVVGKDIKFPNPYKPDLIIKNDYKNNKKRIFQIIKFINDRQKNN